MSGTFKITISELREIIQEIISESVIEEKFGEKIGNQYAGPGVADERENECMMEIDDDDESIMCKCGGENVIKMDADGHVKCKDCGRVWMHLDESAPKGYEKIVKGIKKSGTAKNPWAIANAMKKKGIKPKKK
jgi:hypothetical protein